MSSNLHLASLSGCPSTAVTRWRHKSRFHGAEAADAMIIAASRNLEDLAHLLNREGEAVLINEGGHYCLPLAFGTFKIREICRGGSPHIT